MGKPPFPSPWAIKSRPSNREPAGEHKLDVFQRYHDIRLSSTQMKEAARILCGYIR